MASASHQFNGKGMARATLEVVLGCLQWGVQYIFPMTVTVRPAYFSTLISPHLPTHNPFCSCHTALCSVPSICCSFISLDCCICTTAQNGFPTDPFSASLSPTCLSSGIMEKIFAHVASENQKRPSMFSETVSGLL